MIKAVFLALMGISIFLSLFSFLSADIIINEVMYSLEGTDTGREWIEIFNNGSGDVNLTGWKFYEASTKHALTLINGSTIIISGGYGLISDDYNLFLIDNPNFLGNLFDSSFSLSDSGEFIAIYNGSDYISNLSYNNTWGANANNKSLQYCSGAWIENSPTPGSQNNCTVQTTSTTNSTNLTNSNSTTNITTNTTQNSTNASTNATIEIEFSWDEEDILNNKEFEINLKSFNLESRNYAVKVWLEFENDSGKVISDRYDSLEDKWQSGFYWIYDFFQGPGNLSRTIKLRLKNNYDSFSGDAKIFFKLKNSTEYQIWDYISILKNNSRTNNVQQSKNSLQLSISPTQNSQNPDIIKLGSQTQNEVSSNSIIYKSKNEYIKEYMPYAFSIICIFLIIILIIDKKR